jgi:hypothetical protein
MGRRSRARGRADASAAGPAGPARAQGRRRWLRLLNPFASGPPSRSRARNSAAGFAVAAVACAVLGRLTGEAAWFNSASLLAILALAWGLAATFMGGRGRP